MLDAHAVARSLLVSLPPAPSACSSARGGATKLPAPGTSTTTLWPMAHWPLPTRHRGSSVEHEGTRIPAPAYHAVPTRPYSPTPSELDLELQPIHPSHLMLDACCPAPPDRALDADSPYSPTPLLSCSWPTR